MSITNYISSLPDTRRTFTSGRNTLALVSGVFVTAKDFSFASVNDFKDIDKWYDALEAGNITPLHYSQEFISNDEETVFAESLQDSSYLLRLGRYRHKLRYDWDIDTHEAVNELTGTDYYVFYWDENRNIIGTSDDGTTVRGFKTNRLMLEKPLFANQSEPSFSVLDIELADADEMAERRVVEQMDWYPSDVDRLFASITIEYIDSDNLNFTAKYIGNDIDSISLSDIQVIDNVNGELTFSFFNYSGGVYQLSNFSDPLTTGTLKILSSLYLGCKLYRVAIAVTVVNDYFFEDGTNYNFEDGSNYIFDN